MREQVLNVDLSAVCVDSGDTGGFHIHSGHHQGRTGPTGPSASRPPVGAGAARGGRAVVLVLRPLPGPLRLPLGLGDAAALPPRRRRQQHLAAPTTPAAILLPPLAIQAAPPRLLSLRRPVPDLRHIHIDHRRRRGLARRLRLLRRRRCVRTTIRSSMQTSPTH